MLGILVKTDDKDIKYLVTYGKQDYEPGHLGESNIIDLSIYVRNDGIRDEFCKQYDKLIPGEDWSLDITETNITELIFEINRNLCDFKEWEEILKENSLISSDVITLLNFLKEYKMSLINDSVRHMCKY